jgi:hypothetical protein
MEFDGTEYTPGEEMTGREHFGGNMTDQERIKRLVEWMGWKSDYVDHGGSIWFTDGKGTFHGLVRDWNPLTSLDHTRMLEDEVERRGLTDLYVKLLFNVVTGNNYTLPIVDLMELWDIAYATPEQRCRAVDKLMEENDGSK